VLRPGVIEHWCPGCCAVHSIDIHALSQNGRVMGWDGDMRNPTIAEPVRHLVERGTCDYILRGGRLIFMNNCWHPLAGQQRTLEEFPR
jgi:hypothetical protein